MTTKRRLLALSVVTLSALTAGVVFQGSQARADRHEHEGSEAREIDKLRAKMADAQLDLAGAIAQAEAKTGGDAIEAEYELEGDGLEIEVVVLTEEQVLEVEFDAMSGKLLEVEVEDDEDEHDDDDHDDDDDYR